MPARNFTHCVCPNCKAALDDVVETAAACPACNRPLERRAVWMTRKYPGVIILPLWVRAFGWPMVLIGAGVAVFLVSWLGFGLVELKISALLIAMGLVYFFAHLSGSDK